MTPRTVESVPGAARLLGHGVYTELPRDLRALGARCAVVTGDATQAVAAARRLGRCGCRTTIATREDGRRCAIPPADRSRLRRAADVTLVYGAEVIWAVGLDHLEAVVLRHVPSGRVLVRNADALFMLPTPRARE